ncbi:MAG: hypothetical protein O3C60_16935 [Planctomycetota bacterium]|nr:hypothetical protein [Planctomycetota bacterium]
MNQGRKTWPIRCAAFGVAIAAMVGGLATNRSLHGASSPEVTPQSGDNTPDPGEPQAAPATVNSPQVAGEPTVADGPRPVWEPTTNGDGPSVIQFNRVVPGVTLVTDVHAQWGVPLKSYPSAGQQVMAYKVPGFKQVDILASDELVDAILVHLQRPLPVEHIALDLNLRDLRTVLIPDAEGNLLGQGFPERGVLLHYAVQVDQGLVSEIMLEPVRGELFRLRAEYDFDFNYENGLSDLKRAVVLDPLDARAHCLLAKAHQHAGELPLASDAIQTAISLDPESVFCQIAYAGILADQGNVTDAIGIVRDITEREGAHTVEKAEAHLVLGDLLAYGPKPDYLQALEHHLKAVQLSVDGAGAQQFLLRRMAKQVLIQAHASIARDIAGGYFQRQTEVVPKWLDRAQRLAKEYLERDQGDPAFRIELYRRMLDAYALLPAQFDPQVAVEQILTDGRQLIANHADARFQQRVEWEMAQALYQAGEIERARGNGDKSLQFANNAIALFENARTGRTAVAADGALEGQLYFLLGALYAVHKQDHAEAVKWFDKAEPLLRGTTSPSRFADYGLNGERFVSMGVSFWETQQQQRAIDSTLHGVTLIKQAVNENILTESSLSVPYGNLATMHQNMGNQNAAQRYAQMMAKAEKPTAELQR